MRWKFWKKETLNEQMDRTLRQIRENVNITEPTQSQEEEDMANYCTHTVHFKDGETIHIIYGCYDNENNEAYTAYFSGEDGEDDEEFLRVYNDDIRYVEVDNIECRKTKDIEYGFSIVKPKPVKNSNFEVPSAKPMRLKEVD